MKNTFEYFLLFKNCITVRGAKRSTICDLQLSRYKIIPNLLLDILDLLKTKNINSVKNHYNNVFNNGIDAYLNTLVEEGWGCYIDDIDSFPDIDLKWNYPGLVSNSIIDIENELLNYKNIISQLNSLGCEALQVRFYRALSLQDITYWSDIFKETSISYIEFIAKYNPNILEQDLIDFLTNNAVLQNIYLYNSPFEKITNKATEHKIAGTIIYLRVTDISENSCGVINTDWFSVNIKHFTESINFNSCLNRKISIDKYGNLKNCPSMKEYHGNIKETSLSSILSKQDFTRLWNINKEQIEVCKDCEFRHICTDCRAFIANPNNYFSKPLKCSYNPYENIWEK